MEELIRGPYVDKGEKGIDCEFNHPIHGWVPFTASPDDPEQYGRDIYNYIVENNLVT